MNLPNRLTLLRVALVPLYLVLLWFSQNSKLLSVLALAVFAAASLTDLFDGKIARKRHLITNFGKFMDPIADKLLTHTAFIMLAAMGRLNVVACIVFIAREFVVSGLRLCAVEQGHVIAAGMSGKIKTVLQMILAMLLTLVSGGYIAGLLTFATAVMTLYSMGEYVWQNRSVLGGAR
ncbi:MAG TPA: CDP-diacylglycerol--glycerol-3-phosphate 3-phosphatidyltransferase [Candidatus Ventricola gallistercoris]|nr:CDP-diacylglycerol--glycerol-3-phosphate 3-phosphatidyltransferase [Candidatus Ventricola gallistercoris]